MMFLWMRKLWTHHCPSQPQSQPLQDEGTSLENGYLASLQVLEGVKMHYMEREEKLLGEKPYLRLSHYKKRPHLQKTITLASC